MFIAKLARSSDSEAPCSRPGARNAYGRRFDEWKLVVREEIEEERAAAAALAEEEAQERARQEEEDRLQAEALAADEAAKAPKAPAYKPGEIIARLAEDRRDEMTNDRPSRWRDSTTGPTRKKTHDRDDDDFLHGHALDPAPPKRVRVVAKDPPPPPKAFFPLFTKKKKAPEPEEDEWIVPG